MCLLDTHKSIHFLMFWGSPWGLPKSAPTHGRSKRIVLNSKTARFYDGSGHPFPT